MYNYNQQSPPPSATHPHAHGRNGSLAGQSVHSGYSPVSYDAPVGPYGSRVSPEEFYGSLIEPSSARPSEVFCRLADALFFYMDQNVDVPQLRMTQHMEPAKYGWFQRATGTTAKDSQLVVDNLQSFYETVGVPFRIVPIKGVNTPILDRRGFLHMCVFEARAAPNEAYQNWQKFLAIFNLLDPSNNTPFPTPIPRSAFPYHPELELATAYQTWQFDLVAKSARADSQAMAASLLAASPTFGGAAAAGLGLGGAASYLQASNNPYMAQFAALQNQMQSQALGAGNPYMAMMQAQSQAASDVNPYLAMMQAQSQAASDVNPYLSMMQAGSTFGQAQPQDGAGGMKTELIKVAGSLASAFLGVPSFTGL